MSDDWKSKPRPHEIRGELPVAATVPAVFAHALSRFGDLPYLRDEGRVMTYAQVDAESRRLSRGLIAMGIAKGTRVGIMMPNGIDWVLAWLAICRIGAVAVGLSTLFQRREIQWALRHNDIDTLLVSASFGKADFQQRIEQAFPMLADRSGQDRLFLPDAPYLRRIVVVGGPARPWAMQGWDALDRAASATPQADDRIVAAMEAAVSPADDMLIICTSGTTSEPKGVICMHGPAMRNGWNFAPYTLIDRGENFYCGMPFFWVGGFIWGILPVMNNGACLCFPASLSGEDILSMLVRDHVTGIFPVAAQLHAIRHAAEEEGIDLGFIRNGYVAHRDADTGEPIPPDRRMGGTLGMTETFGTHSTDQEGKPTPLGKAGHWGRAMPGIERRIVSLDTGEPLGPGEVGELQLRGSGLMRGYVKKERHEIMTGDGFFPTGDRCMIDEDDLLYFYGRAKDMIKTSGANVAPAEVEAALLDFPEVREAIVLGLPDIKLGEIVAAVLVPEHGHQINCAGIGARLREEISSYKIPRIVVIMDYEDVPRTDAAEKPRRNVLREQLIARLHNRPEVAPLRAKGLESEGRNRHGR
ncbi:class I adenylate-forming enzyme family protein [Sphingobium sp. Sx8-8]|uniref:class I adenylate-forming enzyme family protein n=1 Tax=Sphingobium sp. Sx8-8 TaxID=2933617 RepID=UPI001F55CABB|nr:class I adenylate-forming enzyme family protein [Sphingobium sp. Sx8-8]